MINLLFKKIKKIILLKKKMLTFDLSVLSLSIIYFFFTLVSFYIFIRTISSKSIYKICIPYYIGMILCTLLRGGEFIVINHFQNNITKFIYFIMGTPNMIFMCVYLFLVWHFLSKFIINHINVANDKNIFKEDVPEIKKKINYVLFFLLPIYLIVFIIISFLEFKGVINEQIFFIIISSLEILTPFILVFFYFFLSCKFSGRPFKDHTSKKEMKYIIFVCIYWSVSRFISGVTILIVLKYYLKYFNDLKNLPFGICVGIIVYFFIFEIIPIYFSIGSELSKTFIKKDNSESLIDENGEGLMDQFIDGSVIQSNDIESNKFNFMKNNQNQKRVIKNLLIPSKDISLLNEIFSRKNGLGKINKGTYKGEEIACRVVTFQRLSRYELEAITKDFEILIPLNNPNICKIIGICIENDNMIMIVSNYYKKGSLFDLLHVRKEKLSDKNKLNIAIGIIKGLQYLHENNIIHYHLSSRNIYIEDDLTPLIADFGFYSLKENASIFSKYMNKNSYSSPEMLMDKKKICHKLNNENDVKSDIYSFGILLWEIYTETIPFDVKLSELKKYILEEKYRPEVPNEINKEIAELIRACWDSEINKRPSSNKILSVLLKISNDEI